MVEEGYFIPTEYEIAQANMFRGVPNGQRSRGTLHDHSSSHKGGIKHKASKNQFSSHSLMVSPSTHNFGKSLHNQSKSGQESKLKLRSEAAIHGKMKGKYTV